MIGEIRDLETAQIAVQASLTGHLVLATLHTNDAASAVTRLADMGVEPYLLASSLLGVLAQRLVRTLCPACRVAAPPSAGEATMLAAIGLRAAQPRVDAPGCAQCNDTRLSRPHRRLRAAGRRRRDAPADPRRRRASSRCATPRCAPACGRCAPTARAGSRRARRRSPSWCASRATSEPRDDDRVSLGSGRRAGQACGAAVLDAASARAARDRLRADGLTPTAVDAAPDRGDRSRIVRLPPEQLALLTRQLATLAQSGMPLDQALAAVAEQADDARAEQIVAALRNHVAAGESLPAALARYPRTFSPLYRGLVAAGSESGRLPDVLARLADYLEARAALRQKFTTALIYPALVTVIALARHRRAAGLRRAAGRGRVPAEPADAAVADAALIATSAFFRATGWFWLAAFAAAVVAFASPIAGRRFARAGTRGCCGCRASGGCCAASTPRASRARSRSSSAAARRCCARSTPPATSCGCCRSRMRRARRARWCAKASRCRARSRSRRCFRRCWCTSSPTASRAGALAPMLERAAGELEREAERRLAWVTALMQPALIVLMGAIVLVLVLAVMLPIVSMNQLVR